MGVVTRARKNLGNADGHESGWMEGQLAGVEVERSCATGHRLTGEAAVARSWREQRAGRSWHEQCWVLWWIAGRELVVWWCYRCWRPTCSRRCDAPTAASGPRPEERFAAVEASAEDGRVVEVVVDCCS